MPILPRKLEIHGYFAFREPQEIQFEPLWKSGGLWGILGPNGAGKSSILEAILLALYHKSPRTKSKDTIKTRGFSGKSYIRFYFEHEGKTYLCVYPDEEVKKLHKKGNSSYELIKVKDVESLLGLRYEDFILTVILPQGRFARLLEASLADQSRIFSSFLPDKPWEIIMERVKNVENYLEKKKNTLDGQMNTYKSQFERLSDVTSEKLETLEKQIQERERRKAQLDDRLKELNTQLKKAIERDKMQERYQVLSREHANLHSQKQYLEKISQPAIGQLLREIDHQARSLRDIESEIKKKKIEIKNKDEEIKKKKAGC